MKKILALLLLVVPASVFAQADFEKKLKELGIELFPPTKPMGSYVKAVRTGNLLYLAGHGPTRVDKLNITVKVGKDLTLE